MKPAPNAISDHIVKRVILSLSLPGYQDVRDAVFLVAYAGMRPAEITALQWADVNEREGTIIVRNPKNMKSRIVPIADELGQALRLRRERLQAQEGPVFGAASKNTIVRFHNGFRRFTTSSGKHVTWSALRRWYAASLASASSTHTQEIEQNE